MARQHRLAGYCGMEQNLLKMLCIHFFYYNGLIPQKITDIFD